MTKPKHGGRRAGAGRPGQDRTSFLHLRCTPEQKAAIEAIAEAEQQTVTEYVLAAALDQK